MEQRGRSYGKSSVIEFNKKLGQIEVIRPRDQSDEHTGQQPAYTPLTLFPLFSNTCSSVIHLDTSPCSPAPSVFPLNIL